MIDTELKVQFTKFERKPIVFAVEDDTGRDVRIIPVDYTIYANETAVVEWKRPDGETGETPCRIENGEVIVNIKDMITENGDTIAMLRFNIPSGGAPIHVRSFPFTIHVQKSTAE